MPNYKYKCTECLESMLIDLPMSFDPKQKFSCSMCLGEMTRRIITSVFPEKVGKVFAGDWFKKTYGSELGGDAISREDFRKDLKKAEELAKRDGINTNVEHVKKLED